MLAYAGGDLDRATRLLEDVVAASQAIGEPIIPELARHFLGLIASEAGDSGRALALIRARIAGTPPGRPHDALILTRIAGVIAQACGNAGVIAQACGNAEVAARLFGAVASTGAPMLYPERRVFERTEKRAHQDR